MRTKLTALAVVAAAVAYLTAVAAAAPVTAKQRVEIQENGGSFVLVPLTSGAIKSDSGTASFCCWTARHIMRDGQAMEINDPQMTLTLKRGTLVVSNQIGWVDIPNGWAVFTGTWKVLRGTGDYAGLSGGGRRAGVQLANGGRIKSQFEGFLGPK